MSLTVSITFVIPKKLVTEATYRAFRDELRALLHKHFPGWDIGKACPIHLAWTND